MQAPYSISATSIHIDSSGGKSTEKSENHPTFQVDCNGGAEVDGLQTVCEWSTVVIVDISITYLSSRPPERTPPPPPPPPDGLGVWQRLHSVRKAKQTLPQLGQVLKHTTPHHTTTTAQQRPRQAKQQSKKTAFTHPNVAHYSTATTTTTKNQSKTKYA